VKRQGTVIRSDPSNQPAKSWLFCLLVLSFSSASFADGDSGTIAFVFENDVFAGTDQNYTNGVRLSWLSESAESAAPGLFGSDYAQFLKNSFNFLPGFGNDDKQHSASFAISQFMVTPEDLEATQLLPDQSPYAGLLLFETGLFAWDQNDYREIEFTLGVAGPDSGAGATQRFIHRAIDAPRPRGWDNQIDQRIVAGVTYARGHRLLRDNYSPGYSWDLIGNYGATAGNLLVSGGGFLSFRWGKNLPYNFNMYYSRSGSESALLGLPEGSNQSGWYLVAAAAFEASAYNYLEEAIEDTHTISTENSRASLILGGVYFRNKLQIGFNMQRNSYGVEGEDETYGALHAIWSF